MQAKTVLVLGGGVGGIVAANHLRRRLPRQHRVILVDRERAHLFQPSLLWLAVGDRTPASIQRPLERLLQKGIEVITGEITEIDPTTRTIRAGGQDVSGDALIVALGADLAPDAIPGLAAAGHNLYTLEGATTFRGALAACRGGRIVVLTAAPAYKCPAAPYEAIMLVEAAMRRRGTRGECVLDLYAAEAGPMGVAGPHVSAAVRSVVESKGISYHPLHQVVTVDPVGRRLAFANGATAEFDLLAYVPPHRVPAVVGASGLVDESGWVPVNRETFETRFQGVYAIGDVTIVPLTMGKPLPKAGVFAHGQAEVVASNVVWLWTGAGGRRTFSGEGQCFLETGDGRAGLGAGNFYGEPTPVVTLRRPSRWWHWGKVLFERRWLRQWI
ncbi:MAG: NAD(P)/FAD-dependent oxidoreductase [Gemmatimonadetes bacterium]|nr:NAD(P)/FAD-dependent oxidoreductase [Gemmatimonadota bacterium]